MWLDPRGWIVIDLGFYMYWDVALTRLPFSFVTSLM